MSRYEDRTFENLQKEMLDDIAEEVDADVSEGSFIATAIAKQAVRLEDAYTQLDYINDNMMVDTMDRDHLQESGAEAGLLIGEGTEAVVTGYLNTKCEIGDEFTAIDSEYNYIATEYLGTGVLQGATIYNYNFEAEDVGKSPGTYIGDIEPVDQLDGFEYGKITALVTKGEDEEDTEDYRERRLNWQTERACAGNRAYYREVILSLDGVGGVKLPRRIDGEEYITCYVQASDYGVVSGELLKTLKEEIDPEASEGAGYGLAPIGHKVKVQSVTAVDCAVTAKIEYTSGKSYEDVSDAIDQAIRAYILKICEGWQETDAAIIRISGIESALLAVENILDVSEVTINGDASNLQVGPYQIPKYKSFTEAE